MPLRDFLESNGLFQKTEHYLLQSNTNSRVGGLFTSDKLKVFFNT